MSALMREILLHGAPDEAFDRSVSFARRIAESFGGYECPRNTRSGCAATEVNRRKGESIECFFDS